MRGRTARAFRESVSSCICTKIIIICKDTTDFILKLRQNNSSHLLENDPFLVTMDVESLCPNIDHEEGTQACQYYFTTTGLSPTISRYLCKLIFVSSKK